MAKVFEENVRKVIDQSQEELTFTYKKKDGTVQTVKETETKERRNEDR